MPKDFFWSLVLQLVADIILIAIFWFIEWIKEGRGP